MGLVSDFSSIHIAVVVPLICFAVIAAYAHFAVRQLQAAQGADAILGAKA
jgi:hypothetical protein